MYIWKILGIEPTTDIVAIKRAFAQKAKNYHPEEFPEEYKNLRNAYKQAIEYAKKNGKGASEDKSQEEKKTSPVVEKSVEKPEEKPEEKAEEKFTFTMQPINPIRPILEKPSTETLRLEKEKNDRIEIPKLKDSTPEKPILEKPVLEMSKVMVPHIEEITIQKPSVRKRPLVESPKIEMPKIKELLQQEVTPVEIPTLEIPHVEDPMLVKMEKRLQKRAQVQKISRELEFSFDEVDKALSPESIEEFFYHFQAIASNPVIRDNIECWSLFLEQKEIREIFGRKDLCDRMFDLILKHFWGKKDTILYFLYILDVKSAKKYEPPTGIAWTLKKIFISLPKLESEKYMTAEEMTVHNTILAELRKKKISYDLVHFETARKEYLNLYFDIVGDDKQTWKRRWHEFQQVRMRRDILGIVLMLIAAGLGLMLLKMFIRFIFRV